MVIEAGTIPYKQNICFSGCGGYLSTPTGSFTSPGYPNPYDHRRVCEWKIVVPTGQYIQLTIETFDLESHSSCAYDVLEVIMFCLFELILYVPVKNLSVMLGQVFLG